VLDAAGVTACPWIGYSMGGRLALAAALMRPERVTRLVLESASPGIESDPERVERRAADEALARTILEEGIEAWQERWETGPLFAGRRALPPEVLRPFLERRAANRPAALASWLRAFGAGSQASFWSRLGEVAVPTLLVTGARDAKFTALARRMAAALPHARHVPVADAGHTVHLEAPDRWLAAVLPFLRGD
jgi:2-succinyl-6-hydroxy-2,4-cyclohexadiene-1-carboxylate synthase